MSAILLIFLYSCSLVCIGGGCNFHFCGGHLKAVSWAVQSSDGCSKGAQMPEGCCKDISVKCNTGDQSLSKATVVSIVKFDVSQDCLFSEVKVDFEIAPAPIDHHFIGEPPGVYCSRLYLSNRRLLI